MPPGRKNRTYYAVHKGRKPGVYHTWPACQDQVKNYGSAKYKKFGVLAEAEHFVKHGVIEEIPNTSNERPENLKDFTTETLLEIFGEENDFSDVEAKQTLNMKRQNSFLEDNGANIIPRKKLKSNQKTKKYENEDNSPAPSSSAGNLTMDSESRVIVYTDGACSNNGNYRKEIRAGYGVWWGIDHPLNVSARLTGTPTNQRAEIAAVNKAIQQAINKGIKTLCIRTDSMFIINCVTKWVKGWLKKNWIKADGKPVVHKKEFLIMLDALKKVDVKWEHVRGHAGVTGNEMADQLAVSGAKKPLP